METSRSEGDREEGSAADRGSGQTRTLRRGIAITGDVPPGDAPYDAPAVVEVAGRRVTIPPRAGPDEAAAIAVAIGAHVTDRQRAAAAAAEDDGPPDRTGRKWRLAGRLGGLGTSVERVPDAAPADDWTAAGRADRF